MAKQKDHSEATAVGEERAGPLINVVTGGGEKRMDSGYILRVEWADLSDMLDMGLCEGWGNSCQISVLGSRRTVPISKVGKTKFMG